MPYNAERITRYTPPGARRVTKRTTARLARRLARRLLDEAPTKLPTRGWAD